MGFGVKLGPWVMGRRWLRRWRKVWGKGKGKGKGKGRGTGRVGERGRGWV